MYVSRDAQQAFVLHGYKKVKKFLIFIRPFHILHHITIIFLAISVKGLYNSLLFSEGFKLWIITFTMMILLFVTNEYLHKEEDKNMGRERIFQSMEVQRLYLLLVLIMLFIIDVVLSLFRSPVVLGLYVILLSVAVGYGFFKHKRITVLTYVFRFLTGFFMYLFVAVYLGYSSIDFNIALVSGYLDLVANISGDLRDFAKDKEGGIRTLPVVIGIEGTQFFIFFLQLGLIGILQLISVPATQLISVQVLASLLFHLWKKESWFTPWAHMVFHLAKIISLFLIATMFAGFSFVVTVGGLVTLVFLELLAYIIYLWSDDRIVISVSGIKTIY